MIFFHEGLPRSGKSYEACVRYIVKSLKSGRHVYAYIEGLNHEKFSEVCELPIEKVNDLLHQLTREQVPEIYKHVEKDAFVIIDELQNFWPTGRQKLPPEMIKFITEHGHDGLDILCMGQALSDCHPMWRRRVEQKTFFVKRNAVGQPNSYTWKTYKRLPTADTNKESWQQISSGKGNYEEKYFGLYKSHTDGTSNTVTYEDDRANIFKTKAFTLVLPLFVLAFFFAIYKLYGFFTPSNEPKVQTSFTTEAQKPDLEKQFEAVNKPERKEQKKPETPPEPPPLDYFDGIAQTLKLRLAGWAETKDKFIVQIDALDNSNRVKERFDAKSIEAFGWTINKKPYGLLLTKESKNHIVRSWPLDIIGRVPEHTSNQL